MFKVSSRGEFNYLHFAPWTERGIHHGFLLGGIRAGESEEHFTARFEDEFQKRIRLLKQVHGCVALPFSGGEERGEADGWFGERGELCGAVGVKTADCVPVLLRLDEKLALLHIGWRGVAQRFLPQVVEQIASKGTLELIIGPCASPTRYEIQGDILREFKQPPLLGRGPAGELTLDLVGTILRDAYVAGAGRALVYSTYQCTISNRFFESHRRDGEASGRNVSFLIGR